MSRRANKKKGSRKKAEAETFGTVWSFGFFLATLSNYLLCPVVFILLLVSPVRERYFDEVIIAYCFGLFSAGLLVSTSKIRKLRTIIHEIKHAIMVLLTGNKVKSIKADKYEGHVEYKLYQNRAHLAPLIKLAPYFFPLFSLPMLGMAVFFDSYVAVICSLGLGAALAADICFGIEEIHPFQTDFKKLLGGIFISKAYLVGFYLLWPSVITLWVRSGGDGIFRGAAFVGKIILLRFGLV
ncbi:MAG TPA: hypothetical protein PKA63_07935 [Oligoflexia bacterium]|nr:hypothetical protein [Oligoflexia bacterium]